MSQWLRFYPDAMRNPKVARLSDAQFRLWMELLGVASENDGLIPPLDTLKNILKRRLDHLLRGLDDLVKGGLIDPLEVGYEPHNWSKFQYKSDTSTPRVTFHRQKKNVSMKQSETAPDTDTDTDTEDTLPKGSGGNAVSVDPEKEFWAAAKAYLSSVSRNPGPLIGKWHKTHDRADIKKAITRAQLEGAIEPIAFIEGCLRQAKKAADDDDLYRFDGPC